MLMVCQWAVVVTAILCGVQQIEPEPWTIIALTVGVLIALSGTLYAEKSERRDALAALQAVESSAVALPGRVPQELALLRAALGAWAAQCTAAVQQVEARLDAMPL